MGRGGLARELRRITMSLFLIVPLFVPFHNVDCWGFRKLSFDFPTMLLRCLSDQPTKMTRECISESVGGCGTINNGSISKLRLRIWYPSMNLTLDFYLRAEFMQAGTSIWRGDRLKITLIHGMFSYHFIPFLTDVF